MPTEVVTIEAMCMQLCKKLGLEVEPPVPCQFKIGDHVIFTNDYGVEFEEYVIGFTPEPDPALRNGFIHLATNPESESGSAWWYPHHEQCLRKGDNQTN